LGCSLTDTIEITSICEPILYIPTAFSPNADRRNDLYKVQSTQALTYFQMTIFNRWGEVVFSTEDIDFEWDGLFKGEVCPQGLYPFRILYRYPDVKGRIFQKEERGNLYIIN
jgi:gliding motility-associated-like protein